MLCFSFLSVFLSLSSYFSFSLFLYFFISFSSPYAPVYFSIFHSFVFPSTGRNESEIERKAELPAHLMFAPFPFAFLVLSVSLTRTFRLFPSFLFHRLIHLPLSFSLYHKYYSFSLSHGLSLSRSLFVPFPVSLLFSLHFFLSFSISLPLRVSFSPLLCYFFSLLWFFSVIFSRVPSIFSLYFLFSSPTN